jgi:hypothetical protein
MFRPLVITVAALAALALTAGPAVAAPSVPAQTGGTTNTCANPILAANATGWSATGGRSLRSSVSGHPTAQYAFWVQGQYPTVVVTLPGQPVTAGQQWTFRFDVQLAGSVRAGVEWYSASGTRLSGTAGPAGAGSSSTWRRATVSATAPTGATRAVVKATGSPQYGSWWKTTACTYTTTAAPPVTTTTVPPTTTTVPPTTTTVPPSTTGPPTTTVPPTTIVTPTTTTAPPAGPGDGTQAAALRGWGARADGDEFDGTAVNTAKWALYNGPGHNGKGLRRPSQITVADGVLTITGNSIGTTGGMSMHDGRRHGRWETRMQIPRGDSRYHPVLLLWPEAEDWPVGGEVDYAETNTAAGDVDFFLHYSAQNRTTHAAKVLDLTQWHNYAVEWTPTSIKGYIDGVQFFSDTVTSHLPPRAMHQTIQLDWFPNGTTPTAESRMNVAWVRIYNV